jgi:adenylate cyclase
VLARHDKSRVRFHFAKSRLARVRPRPVERARASKQPSASSEAELVVTDGETILQSHRRNVAVLFCDLRSFTEFSEQAEPEEQIAMLADFHTTVAEVINRFHGALVQIAGDGVMVVFNDPIPRPEPALDAVRAAIEMRGRVGVLIAKWKTQGYRLGFGVGITRDAWPHRLRRAFAVCGHRISD